MTSRDDTPGHSGNCFDFLRVIAAWAVLYSHNYALAGLPEPQPIAGQSFGSLAVAFFFAISGFLVCQSWQRDPSLVRFTIRRALRIMPGLCFVIFFTAFAIGPIFSSFPATRYFSEPGVWTYIKNTLLFLSVPILPGLFESNPYPNANNGSLWTLRYEIIMYACLALIGRFLPKAMLKVACLTLFSLFSILWAILVIKKLGSFQIPFVWRLGTELHADRICYLGAFFFAGCSAYLFFARIPLSLSISLIFIGLLALVTDSNLAMMMLFFVIPYAAISIAYRGPKILQKVNGHDYSYGIYIYAFPIQQVVAHLMPNPRESLFAALMISTMVTIFFAALSWHFIESPGLRLKEKLIRKPSDFKMTESATLPNI